MLAESEELTVIQPKMMRIVHLKAFPTLRVGLTGMVTSIIQTQAKMTGRQKSNVI